MATKPNMPKAEFDALVAKLRGPMINTFSVTAGDLQEACATCGERLTNAGAVESCLDGGGLMGMYGGQAGKDAEAALDEATKKYDYMNIYRRVCKAVHLV